MYFQTLFNLLKQYVLAEFPISKYFTEGNLTVYIRMGPNFIEGRKIATVTISRVYDEYMQNVEAGLDPEATGKGEYKKFILWLEKTAKELGYLAVKIEQVQSPRLMAMSLKHGYQKQNPENIYKWLE